MSQLQDTLRALSASKLGKLKYDRNWEVQGRVQDIINDVRYRLTSLAVSPTQPEEQTDSSDDQPDLTEDKPSFQQLSTASTGRKSVDMSGECFIENQLDLYEHDRKEKVNANISIRANEIMCTYRDIDDDASEVRSIRQKHLLSAMDRIASCNDEYENFIVDLRNKQKQTTPDVVNSKFREVENRHKRVLAEKAQSIHSECVTKIIDLSKQAQVVVSEIITLFDNTDNSRHDIQQYCANQKELCSRIVAHFQGLESKSLLTENDVAQAKSLLSSLRTAKDNIEAEVTKMQSSQSSVQAIPQTSLPQAPQLPSALTMSEPLVVQPTTLKPFKSFVMHQSYLHEYDKSIEEFVNNNALKAYKLALQSFIRTTINTISNVSDEDIRQKYQRLADLFSGKNIEFQDKKITLKNNPDALKFSYSFAARTFLSVGVKQVLSVPKAAFPMGAIIALLWKRHIEFGKIFMALLVEKCPYIIGYYPTRESEDTDVSYLVACGYVYGPDKETLETEEAFLGRMRALTRLYGAVIVASVGDGHPQGMEHGWMLLSRTLNTEPKPGVTPAVLHAFLTTILYKLLVVYRKQAVKIVNFVNLDYLKRIEKVSEKEVKKQSIVQLRMFVEDAVKKLRSKKTSSLKPEGVLPDYFFQQSYLHAVSVRFH